MYLRIIYGYNRATQTHMSAVTIFETRLLVLRRKKRISY